MTDLLPLFGLQLSATVVFGLLPALALFSGRDWLARRFFSSQSPESPATGSTLFAVGYGLLGVYFLIEGAQAVVLAGVRFFSSEAYLVHLAWGAAGTALVQLVAGWVLLSSARARVRESAA